jgi:glycine cleavage system H lipoate-binding protein
MDSERTGRQPHEELPCIWVLSGVLSYHLCDRDYECEGCELHHALSGEGRALCHQPTGHQYESGHLSDPTSPHGQASAHLSHLLAGCRLYLDRPYRPPHFWLLETSRDVVTVGLDGSLLRMLRPIRRIVRPGVGLCLERDQPCGWIARQHLAVPLKMPIAGEVIETNETYAAAEEPCLLPEGEDWLFRVRPTEPLENVKGVLRAEATLAWYSDRLRTVKQSILTALSAPAAADLGPVLADGGAPSSCLEEVLGREAFEDLVSRIARS